VTRGLSQKHRTKAVIYLAVFVALAAALWYGRTRAAPNLTEPIGEIFPAAAAFEVDGGVFGVYDDAGTQVGWAASGSAIGYGGPMLLVAGIDTLGQIAGVRVVEQRETPIFWRMARGENILESFAGVRFDEADFDKSGVDWETGATISTDAILASLRASVATVAGEAFDVRMPLPAQPFEFGILEITILALFAVGIVAQRSKSPKRSQARWACQVVALVVVGFWKHSPISLAKLASMMAGYFPDPSSGLAIYLLIAGFLLTPMLFGRNVYCLYVCPFNAAQRLVGLIGGASVKLPSWLVRTAERLRNVVVFAALFLAFLALKPALASYEPFAALFSLTGTALQWLLLFLVLTMSLVISTPFCNLFCPVRTVEKTIHDLRDIIRSQRKVDADG
jgi:hypothetical protein